MTEILICAFAYTVAVYMFGVIVGRLSVRLDRERGKDGSGKA
jgi:hypothetical protein